MEILGQFDFWRAITAGALSLPYSQFIDGYSILRYPQAAIMQGSVSALSIFVAQRLYAIVNQLLLSNLTGSLAGKAQEYFMEPIFAGFVHGYLAPILGTSRGNTYGAFMRGFVLDFGAQQFEIGFRNLFSATAGKTSTVPTNYFAL